MIPKTVKIAVGIPSHHEWAADFGMSLAVMMSYAAQVQLAPDVKSQQVQVINVKGSILPQLRENIVLSAEKIKADYLLFVDADMVFPRDTLHRLYGHKQLVVACNCATKSIPSRPTARKFKEDDVGGEPVYSTGRVGLEKVWRVGTGVMLINMSVFKQIPRPWFSISWDDEKKDYVGEDWSLCAKIEAAKIPLMIDHGLSQQIGHCGHLMYLHEHIMMPEEIARVREAMQVSAA